MAKNGNSTLTKAKNAKKDEFYTQLPDIEAEMNAYLDYDKDVFRNKTVLLPCDDPEWSWFTKYFAKNFQLLGLKKLISTSYAPDAKKAKYGVQTQLFEDEANSPGFDPTKWHTHGKIYILEKDINGDGRIDVADTQSTYLEGDGDFQSTEVTHLRDEADIIITNPPFSMFREFFKWVIESEKQFSIIGSLNAITYKEVFPYLRDNKIWLGNGFKSGNAYFATPNAKSNIDYSKGVLQDNGLVKFRNCCWYTNIEHGRRHQPLELMTMADNLKYSKHKDLRNAEEYDHYDNYNAIEVPYTDAIPSDYNGVMGVPISFLDKYCPEQFEIVGLDRYVEDNPKYGHRFTIDNKETYARILIRNKHL